MMKVVDALKRGSEIYELSDGRLRLVVPVLGQTPKLEAFPARGGCYLVGKPRSWEGDTAIDRADAINDLLRKGEFLHRRALHSREARAKREARRA